MYSSFSVMYSDAWTIYHASILRHKAKIFEMNCKGLLDKQHWRCDPEPEYYRCTVQILKTPE